MMNKRLLALAGTALLAAGLSAQQPCSDNLWPVHVVDNAGTELPVVFDEAIQEDAFLVPTEKVFLAFDPNVRSGTYYVHVTDTPVGDGNDNVMSMNDPMDRFVTVDNNNGVITLSLPFSENPQDVEFGVGLGGVGQSICVGPLNNNSISSCRFKLWYGDKWDLTYGPTDPYILQHGVHDNGDCVVRSYHSFRIGDGNGSDVSGCVFGDSNRDGTQDDGETGVSGQEVRLISDTATLSATTGADGCYTFENVGKADFTIELVVPDGFIATTPASFPLTVCDCAAVAAPSFGMDIEVFQCDAEPLCYWWSWQGLCEAQAAGVLPTLPALGIVNTCGYYVCPSSKWQLKWYLRCYNFWNMGYALSAQLVAMHANVMTGRVSPDCVICDPCLGVMTVGELMQQATASLLAHPYTPWCGGGQARHQQNKLRKALRRANRNQIWQ